MAKTIRIPISNILGGGDYTGQILVGSQQAVANVILDTGSSTLAVQQTHYKAVQDKDLKPTVWAQDIEYGTGGWAGPVVNTTVTMGSGANAVTLPNTPIAVADEQEANNFSPADGILGLAYNNLNNAYNLQKFLIEHGVKPPVSYPWPFPVHDSSSAIDQFAKFLASHPEENITAYFDLLAKHGITRNKFAFSTHRSVPSAAKKNPAQDPLNQGVLVLGGGEEEKDLYSGSFLTVQVVDDAWYNTTLKAVQVAGGPLVLANPLPPRYVKSMMSNSIVDSGTNSLVLATDVWTAILKSLETLNPQFATLALQALKSDTGVPSANVKLKSWPGISFILAGEKGEDVTLTCSPSTYWQVDAPSAGRAMFQLGPGGQVQSILGLPLMNNYFTVFDRSLDRKGVIRFATIK